MNCKSILQNVAQFSVLAKKSSSLNRHRYYFNPLLFFRQEKEKVKLPRDIDDAKELGRVLSKYKDTYYYEVMSAFFITYVLYPLEIFVVCCKVWLNSLASGWFWRFSQKNSSFQLPYQRPSSSANCARELFNGSNGSASLVDCTRKKIFCLGGAGFLWVTS